MLTFAVRLILENYLGHLLFLRQTKSNGGQYTLVGGTVEDHEFAREALAREASEEAGIEVNPADLQLVHVMHRHKLKKNEVSLVLYFKTTQYRGMPGSLEPKKFADVAWLNPDQLPEEVSKANRHVLRQIRSNLIYSEFPTKTKILAFWEQFGMH
ncbi:MAG: NUDIX domain-containing protein [Saprospiraceae bacterium]|nr:NUDIX domain-containing protein [Saprospiraceae bacterium]